MDFNTRISGYENYLAWGTDASVFSVESLMQALEDQKKVASNRKRYTSGPLLTPYQFCLNLHHDLLYRDFVPDHPDIYRIFDSNRRKHRTIEAPRPREAIVERAIWNTYNPVIERSYFPYSFCGVTGRGATNAVDRVFRQYQKLYTSSIPQERNSVVIQGDIRHFYQSVDHDILRTKMSRFFRPPLLDLYMKFTYPKTVHPGGHGVGIGHLLSQISGTVYLTDFDFWVTDTFPSCQYTRYADDFILLGVPSDQASYVLNSIIRRLATVEKLSLKDPKIIPLHYTVDFVGGVMKHNKLFIRDVVSKNFLKAVKASKIQSVICYLSKARKTSSYVDLRNLIPLSMLKFLPEGF